MDWGSVITALIAGGLVAVINLVDSRLKRKDKIADGKDETAQKIEDLKGETKGQLDEVGKRIDVVEQKVDSISADTKLVVMSQKAQAYDRIRFLGMQYIKKNRVMESEYKNLLDLYGAYTDLLGKKDDFLQRVMDEVAKTRIIPDGGDYREIP